MEKSGGGGGAAAAAPTGCYKCGRPGHWSRDCPFSGSDSNPNLPNLPPRPSFKTTTSGGPSKPFTAEKSSEKPKKVTKKRHKLTPELLLSDDGVGYVLRHFPKAFKCRGRGHEVSDLGNLIGLYSQWHSRLLPYYSFDQFIQKVEQVGTTKRVRTCMRELRERVHNGGDPSKLHEPPVEHTDPNCEPAVDEANNFENPSSNKGDPPLESRAADDMQEGADDVQEEMLDEIYKNATEEQQSLESRQAIASQLLPDQIPVNVPSNPVSANEASNLSEIQISEEQKARIEANRKKALERAAARARSSQSQAP